MHNEVKYCGRHLLLEIWCTKYLNSLCKIEETATILKKAAENAGATVLGDNWHHFGNEYGFTGVVLLAESHISIHTWPEHGYAAIDVFMCGDCNPHDTVEIIVKHFETENYNVNEIIRGILE